VETEEENQAKPDRATPKPKPDAKPEAKPDAKPEPAPETKPATEPPAPPKADAKPANTPPPETKPNPEEKPAVGGKKSGKKTAPPKPDTSNLDDAAKFKLAKATAQEDAAIKELAAKAESAISDADAHNASVAYNKALFRKIRAIDPSLDGYVDKMEEAMMKRLNSEKKRE
jgi:hypothetical protein